MDNIQALLDKRGINVSHYTKESDDIDSNERYSRSSKCSTETIIECNALLDSVALLMDLRRGILFDSVKQEHHALLDSVIASAEEAGTDVVSTVESDTASLVRQANVKVEEVIGRTRIAVANAKALMEDEKRTLELISASDSNPEPNRATTIIPATFLRYFPVSPYGATETAELADTNRLVALLTEAIYFTSPDAMCVALKNYLSATVSNISEMRPSEIMYFNVNAKEQLFGSIRAKYRTSKTEGDVTAVSLGKLSGMEVAVTDGIVKVNWAFGGIEKRTVRVGSWRRLRVVEMLNSGVGMCDQYLEMIKSLVRCHKEMSEAIASATSKYTGGDAGNAQVAAAIIISVWASWNAIVMFNLETMLVVLNDYIEIAKLQADNFRAAGKSK